MTDRDCISILELCNRWSVFKHDGMPGDKLVAALILSHDLPIYSLEEENYHVDKEGYFFDLSNSKMDYDEESDNFNDILTKMVNFHSKCKILGGVAEFFSKAFLCRFPPENFPRPVVYPVHSLPV